MSVPEIRREKVDVTGLSSKQIREKYGISFSRASRAVRVGYFVKNYSTPQIVIDPRNFNLAYAYNVAGKVFWKNFSTYPTAMSLMQDMVQEAVKRMYELSGKLPEMENEKYNRNYQLYFIAHNAMLSFYKSYMKTNRVIETCRDILKQYPVFQRNILTYDDEVMMEQLDEELARYYGRNTDEVRDGLIFLLNFLTGALIGNFKRWNISLWGI